MKQIASFHFHKGLPHCVLHFTFVVISIRLMLTAVPMYLCVEFTLTPLMASNHLTIILEHRTGGMHKERKNNKIVIIIKTRFPCEDKIQLKTYHVVN